MITTIARFVFFWLLVAPSMAVELTATDKLNAFVTDVDSFQAKFSQTVIDPLGQVVEEATGVFKLERPGKFRWDYAAPYPQHIVADGNKIWFYDVDLEQVTVKSQLETLAETPASLLSGDTLPAESYVIEELPTEDGLAWVMLTPKDQESSFKAITLAFSGETLQQMIMLDSFDQRTRLAFSQVLVNRSYSEQEFIFVPPEGVDVVGDAIE